jgi:oligopeptide/dipeptide ABC transporter ATP-binding protein
MMKIKDAIAEPLAATGTSSKEETHEAVGRIMDAVGLNREYANRFPHEFSGGQRQRIGIARAFISSPDFVVLDEPTSALDASTQAQILNLLKRLKSDFHLSTLFITHNMKVVSFMSDRIAVMYLGEIVEIGTTGEVISDPLHPYTMMLIASIPKGDPESRMLSDVGRRKKLLDLSGGEIPSPINPPSGCRFHTRCPYVMEKCRTQVPRHARVSPTRTVQCFLYSEESTTTAKGQPE